MVFEASPCRYAGRYSVRALIADGRFSQVHVCVDHTSKMKRAVKIVDTNTFTVSFKDLWEDLGHQRHIVSFLGDFCRGHTHFLVMEYCETNLIGMLQELQFLEGRIFLALFHALMGLRHCHQKSIVHRDVKPANLLVGFDGAVKLADFRVAVSTFDSTTGVVGSLPYMSPQMRQGWAYGHDTDIWSLGVVAYVLLGWDCYKPCADSREKKMLENEMMRGVAREALAFKITRGNETSSEHAQTFVQRVLRWSRHARPAADECLSYARDGILQPDPGFIEKYQEAAFEKKVSKDPRIKHLTKAWKTSKDKHEGSNAKRSRGDEENTEQVFQL